MTPTDVMYIRITQYPGTFLKSTPEDSQSPGNKVVSVRRNEVLQIDRIVIYDEYDDDYFGAQNFDGYGKHHKIVLTDPIENRKTWFVFAEHVDVFVPYETDKIATLLIPRTSAGADLKQGTGAPSTMSPGDHFHLHAAKGRFLTSIRRENAGHYEIKLTEKLNGKETWLVKMDEVDIWLEWEGGKLVWDNIPSEFATTASPN